MNSHYSTGFHLTVPLDVDKQLTQQQRLQTSAHMSHRSNSTVGLEHGSEVENTEQDVEGGHESVSRVIHGDEDDSVSEPGSYKRRLQDTMGEDIAKFETELPVDQDGSPGKSFINQTRDMSSGRNGDFSLVGRASERKRSSLYRQGLDDYPSSQQRLMSSDFGREVVGYDRLSGQRHVERERLYNSPGAGDNDALETASYVSSSSVGSRVYGRMEGIGGNRSPSLSFVQDGHPGSKSPYFSAFEDSSEDETGDGTGAQPLKWQIERQHTQRTGTIQTIFPCPVCLQTFSETAFILSLVLDSINSMYVTS